VRAALWSCAVALSSAAARSSGSPSNGSVHFRELDGHTVQPGDLPWSVLGSFRFAPPRASHRQFCPVLLGKTGLHDNLHSEPAADTGSRGYSAAGRCPSCWRVRALRELGLPRPRSPNNIPPGACSAGVGYSTGVRCTEHVAVSVFCGSCGATGGVGGGSSEWHPGSSLFRGAV